MIDPLTPTTLCAASYGGGVFKTINGGESWSEFNAGLPLTDVYALAIDPVTPTTVYVGTSGGGVYSIQQVRYRFYLPLIQRSELGLD
jgi:hypothetical protein